MAYQYEVKYRAGGYPSPTYSGVKTIYSFSDDDVEYKAKREIARSMVMSPSMVDIIEIKKLVKGE